MLLGFQLWILGYSYLIWEVKGYECAYLRFNGMGYEI